MVLPILLLISQALAHGYFHRCIHDELEFDPIVDHKTYPYDSDLTPHIIAQNSKHRILENPGEKFQKIRILADYSGN
jgi:hypothetical protein